MSELIQSPTLRSWTACQQSQLHHYAQSLGNRPSTGRTHSWDDARLTIAPHACVMRDPSHPSPLARAIAYLPTSRNYFHPGPHPLRFRSLVFSCSSPSQRSHCLPRRWKQGEPKKKVSLSSRPVSPGPTASRDRGWHVTRTSKKTHAQSGRRCSGAETPPAADEAFRRAGQQHRLPEQA